MKRLIFSGLLLLAAFALSAWSQERTLTTYKEKTIKTVPIKDTSAVSGQEMYMNYCAPCHGKEGRGDGPAATALKTPPADLTTLAKRNNGRFPADHVSYVLRRGVEVPAHGSKDMPTWGPLLRSLHSRDAVGDQLTDMRIRNLTDYLKSLQSK